MYMSSVRTLVVLLALVVVGCGSQGGPRNGTGNKVFEDVDFERPIVYRFTKNFLDWAAKKGTKDLWLAAGAEAPLLFNDKPNTSLPPMEVVVGIEELDDPEPGAAQKYCDEQGWYAGTPYGKPTIYVCAKNYYDELPGSLQDARRDPWYGQWRRVAFLVHEAAHGLAGALHAPAGVPAIMCGYPHEHPVLCYSTLTGLTDGDREMICPWTNGGGFCDRPVAQRP